jgi:hypothetical protein
MTITCNHPASCYGIPVILSDGGEVMDYAPGLTAALNRIGWTREQAAVESGYKSARSIEKFWQGCPPSARLLNRLSVELQKHP